MPKPQEFLLEEITWKEARERIAESGAAILPVGSTEQHGPHLPIGTDSYDAYWIAKRVAQSLSPPKPIVLPPVNYGVSLHHMKFPGTVSLNPETLISVVYDIAVSLYKHGVRLLLIVNGHGGNIPALQCAMQRLSYQFSDLTVIADTGEISTEERKSVIETSEDSHSGECETSTTLANREGFVRTDRLKKEIPEFRSNFLSFSGKNTVPWGFRTHELSESGIMGDATKASLEKGRRLLDAHVRNLCKLIEDLRSEEKR
jgi:creatinine amidohydrolase/Fe(II)-dependent formamide hydrolase-like protein